MYPELNAQYEKILASLDTARMMKTTKELLDLEVGQTFSSYHASAQRTFEILQEMGIPNAEKITYAANGKDSYQDKLTPLGWDATVGKVVIAEAIGMEAGTVVADYEKCSFALIKGSTSTPDGKMVRMRLITEEALLAGADPYNALVLVKAPMGPGAAFLPHILDMGAAGVISDFAMNADDAPDGTQWNNAFVEKTGWHVGADDRDFIAFAITPDMGTKLRRALSRGAVSIDVQSNARRFETTVDLVTAMVPGRRKEEFWIFAHLYEPLSNDNSSGIACAMEIAKYIMSKGTPEFSLRLIFGLELYGFAAYAVLRGGDCNMSDKVVGAIDCDAMYLRKPWYINFNCASPALPFYGNTFIPMICDTINARFDAPKVISRNSYLTMYDDDSFLGDSTTGVPTVWPIRDGKNFWHNSKQTIDYVEEEEFAKGTAISALFVDMVINPDETLLADTLAVSLKQLRDELFYCVGSEKEHMTRRYEIVRQNFANFERAFPGLDLSDGLALIDEEFEDCLSGLTDDIPHSRWRDYAEQITPSRLTVGLPCDQTKLPYAKRKRFTNPLYSPMGAILSNMDGKRNLAELFRMAEHETRTIMPEKQVKQMLSQVLFYAQSGYVSLGNFKGVSKDDIVNALRELGVKKGDKIALHSMLSEFGLIEGGPKTILEAFKEAVGEEGTFMTPAFNHCFVNIGGPNGASMMRPFDPENIASIWTGSLPRAMVKMPGAIRTRHLSHSWSVYGKMAEEIADGLKYNDPPMGVNNPLMKMLRAGGKIIHFGSEVTSTTFLHCIEDELSMPGVEDVLCCVKTGNTTINVGVPRNLPGCRDFYHGTEDTIKFFKAAKEKGLNIHRVQLGTGTIKMMDMQELYSIGREIMTIDPFILLCDEGHDASCNALRRKYIAKNAMPEEFKF